MTDRVTEFLAKAAVAPVELRIRDLLAIWGFRARTYDSVGRIQRDLSAAGLRCQPDLTEGGPTLWCVAGRQRRCRHRRSGRRRGCHPRSVMTAQPGSSGSAQQTSSLNFRPSRSASGIFRRRRGAYCGAPESSPGTSTGPHDRTGLLSACCHGGSAYSQGCGQLADHCEGPSLEVRVTLTDVIDQYPRVVHADQDLLGQIDASMPPTSFSSGVPTTPYAASSPPPT